MCQHPLTPTSPAFGNRGMRFEDHISGGSKISSTSAKPRNVLQIQIHNQEITRLSTCCVGWSKKQGTESQSKLLSNKFFSKKGGMICCSSMEGFSFPPSSGLLILGVEGSVIFKELDLRLHLTCMVFVLVENSNVWVQREEIRKNEKNGGKRRFLFLLYSRQLLFSF